VIEENIDFFKRFKGFVSEERCEREIQCQNVGLQEGVQSLARLG